MFFWMPDSPTEAKFLSDDDKVLAIERLRNNQMGVMSREWRRTHFSEALRDVKTWLWFVMIFCISVPSNGISTFGPLIIQSFVSDPFRTMLFNVPVGISHVIAVSTSAYVSMKWKLKGPVIALLCVPPMIGLSILLHYPHDAAHRGVLLAGYFCLSTFTGISKSSATSRPASAHRPSALDILVVCPKHCRRYQAQDHLGARLYRLVGGQCHRPAPLYP